MTSREILESNGYTYTGTCKPCGGSMDIYKNPNFPNVEVKVKKNDNYTKIFKGGQQIAVAGNSNLEDKLKHLELV